jgi:hypothetical protein
MNMFYVHVVKTIFLYTTLPPTKGVTRGMGKDARTRDSVWVIFQSLKNMCSLFWLPCSFLTSRVFFFIRRYAAGGRYRIVMGYRLWVGWLSGPVMYCTGNVGLYVLTSADVKCLMNGCPQPRTDLLLQQPRRQSRHRACYFPPVTWKSNHAVTSHTNVSTNSQLTQTTHNSSRLHFMTYSSY